MVSTVPCPDSSWVADPFWELVLADDELLGIEFDAIVDAAWTGVTPPEAMSSGRVPWIPATYPARVLFAASLAGASRVVADAHGRVRQRSPPP